MKSAITNSRSDMALVWTYPNNVHNDWVLPLNTRLFGCVYLKIKSQQNRRCHLNSNPQHVSQINALSKHPECDTGADGSANNSVIPVTPSAHMLVIIMDWFHVNHPRRFKCRAFKKGRWPWTCKVRTFKRWGYRVLLRHPSYFLSLGLYPLPFYFQRLW
jgi:hypothetical protein